MPAFAVFKLDPKLEKATSASFTGLSGNIRFAWTMVFIVVALLFAGFHIYHRFALPRPASDVSNRSGEGGFMKEFLATFADFFRKKNIGVIILFLLVYRLGESQLVKLASPFLLDSKEPQWDQFQGHLKSEVRYTSLQKAFPAEAEVLFKAAQTNAKWRYDSYVRMASLDFAPQV